ncbi:MAG: hypothetical protein AAGH90_01390 [Pseudomonadota bacterium]
MDSTTDPQAKDETGRQEAYGETRDEVHAKLKQRADGGKVEDLDHGIMREDRRENQVTSLLDERHPNAPETAHADIGPKPAAIDNDKPRSTRELADAYSASEEP